MAATRIVNLRKEKYDVYIGRPSIFGNPYRIEVDGTREEVIEKFRLYFVDRITNDPPFRNAVLKLKGKRLGCYCKPAVCHGDVIAEWLDNQK